MTNNGCSKHDGGGEDASAVAGRAAPAPSAAPSLCRKHGRIAKTIPFDHKARSRRPQDWQCPSGSSLTPSPRPISDRSEAFSAWEPTPLSPSDVWTTSAGTSLKSWTFMPVWPPEPPQPMHGHGGEQPAIADATIATNIDAGIINARQTKCATNSHDLFTHTIPLLIPPQSPRGDANIRTQTASGSHMDRQ